MCRVGLDYVNFARLRQVAQTGQLYQLPDPLQAITEAVSTSLLGPGAQRNPDLPTPAAEGFLIIAGCQLTSARPRGWLLTPHILPLITPQAIRWASSGMAAQPWLS